MPWRAGPRPAAAPTRSRQWWRRSRCPRRTRRKARLRAPRSRRCARERAGWNSRFQVPRIRFQIRFRGELTGSRRKTCATPCRERPTIRPYCLGPPVAAALGLGDSAVYDAHQPRSCAEVAVLSLRRATLEGGQRRLSRCVGRRARNLSGRVGGILVERLLAQQRLGERVELAAVLGEQVADLGVGLFDDPPDLLVDEPLGRL